MASTPHSTNTVHGTRQTPRNTTPSDGMGTKYFLNENMRRIIAKAKSEIEEITDEDERTILLAIVNRGISQEPVIHSAKKGQETIRFNSKEATSYCSDRIAKKMYEWSYQIQSQCVGLLCIPDFMFTYNNH